MCIYDVNYYYETLEQTRKNNKLLLEQNKNTKKYRK